MNVMLDIRRFLQVEGALKLFSTLFFYGIGMGILAPMNSIYLSDGLGLSKGQIVLIFAASLLLNMVITLLVGIASDYMKSKKKLALAAALLCMAGLAIYMRADSFAGALIGMCILTAPSGLIRGQIFAMSRHHFQRVAGEILELAQIWLRAGFSVGFFVGLLIGANLYILATFQGVLWGNMAGYGLLFFMLLSYKEHTGEMGKTEANNGEAFSLAMLLALLMLSCADAIRGLYLPLVVTDLFGKPEFASYVWSVQAVFELLFMTITGYWAARYGSKRIIFAGGLCGLITYTVYASSQSLLSFFLIQPVYSFFVSILFGVAMGYVQRMFMSRTGFGASLYVFITLTASLIGYVLPLVVDGYSPLIFIIPLILAAVSLLLILAVLVKEPKLAAAASKINESAAGKTL